MSEHGGKREGSGRKRGSKTQKTAEIALKAAAEGISPLEYLLSVMRTEIPKDADTDLKVKMKIAGMDAAKAAAPYCHPRLQAIEHSGKDGGDIPVSLKIEYVDPATKKA